MPAGGRPTSKPNILLIFADEWVDHLRELKALKETA
jgi:hypothetical protein